MRTLLLIGAAVLGLGVATTAAPEDEKLDIHRITQNVYTVGHSVVLVGNDGLLLTDVQGLGDSERVRMALNRLSEKPVRYVIATSCEGSALFEAAGATRVAHDNVRKRLDENKKCAPGPVALPTLTFDSELTVYFDNEEVRVIKLPTGRTDGDSVVYFRKANVVATGEAFKADQIPAYSKSEGGNMLGVNEQLHRLMALLPADVKILTGDGAQLSMAEVRKASRVLDGMRDAITEQIRKGASLDQLRHMKILEHWKDLLDTPDGPGSRNYLKFYFDCLTGPPDPTFQL
jgi:cyclase